MGKQDDEKQKEGKKQNIACQQFKKKSKIAKSKLKPF